MSMSTVMEMSLPLTEVAYEKYQTSSTDWGGISKLATQLYILCDDRCKDIGPMIPENKYHWDLERLATVEELEQNGVLGKLQEVQDACYAKGWKAPSSVINVIESRVCWGCSKEERCI